MSAQLPVICITNDLPKLENQRTIGSWWFWSSCWNNSNGRTSCGKFDRSSCVVSSIIHCRGKGMEIRISDWEKWLWVASGFIYGVTWRFFVLISRRAPWLSSERTWQALWIDTTVRTFIGTTSIIKVELHR